MSADPVRARPAAEPPALPWWRHGMVWFMLSGPAIVVVAGFATMAIAYRGAETPIAETPTVKQVLAEPAARSAAPALQARNHAATPDR
jgi:hypothetical protein